MVQDRAVRVVVVDDQHAASVERGRGQRVGDVADGCFSNRAVNQNVDPAPGVAPHADLAAHQLDELLGDREAEPRAAVFPRRRAVGLREGLEQPRLRVLGECRCRCPSPRSAAARRSPLSPSSDTRTTTSPLLGELHGVADQVRQHLPQPARIAAQRRRHVRARRARPARGPWRTPARPASPPCPRRPGAGRSRAPRTAACRPRSSRSPGCR